MHARKHVYMHRHRCVCIIYINMCIENSKNTVIFSVGTHQHIHVTNAHNVLHKTHSIHMHLSTSTHTPIYNYTYIHVYACMHLYIYIYIYIHIYAYIYLHLYINLRISVHACVYIFTITNHVSTFM